MSDPTPSHSLAQRLTVTCPVCQMEWEAEIWLIVDGDERDDLIGQITEGTLHRLVCARCANPLPIAAPLLVLRPEADLPLLYSPAPNDSDDDTRARGRQLIDALQALAGPAWRPEWLTRFLVVSRCFLIQWVSEGRPAAIPEELRPLQQRALAAEAGPSAAPAALAWEALVSAPAFRTATPAFQQQTFNQAASAHFRLFQEAGQMADLEYARQAWEGALALANFGPIFSSTCLSNLGATHWTQYQAQGREPDLNDALAQLTAATADLGQPPSPGAPGWFNNLGLAWQARFDRRGEVDDLDAALAAFSAALEQAGPSAALRPTYLNNWANGLRARYTLLGQAADLDQCLSALAEALQWPALTDELRAKIQDNRGLAFIDQSHTRATRQAKLEDLGQALAALAQAAALTKRESAAFPGIALNLAVGFMEKHLLLAEPSDLEQALNLLPLVAARTDAAAPDAVLVYGRAADALRERGGADDVARAAEMFEKACQAGLVALPEEVLRIAQRWAGWAADRHAWSEAAQAARWGLQAVDQLYRAQLAQSGQKTWLRLAQALPALAAYVLAQAGNLEEAVLALENGRARLLADALERERAELGRLPERGYGELWTRFTAAVEQAGRLERSGTHGADLRDAREQLAAAIAEIQQIPGYEALFKPKSFSEVQQTWLEAYDASAYILVCRAGGLALVMRAGGPQAVWLNFSADDLQDLLLGPASGQASGGYLRAQLGTAPFGDELATVLPALGARVMGPVAAVLRPPPGPAGAGTQTAAVPRVALVPVGRMALLPLHASAYAIDGQPRAFLDDFAVAYLPSATALRHSAQVLAALQGRAAAFLGVGDTEPAGAPPLPYTRLELALAAAQFSGEAATLLAGESTAEAVTRRLPSAAYAHFACHGQFNAADPLASAVLLHGADRLSLADLLAKPGLAANQLVVLSACQTGLTDFQDLPEEAVGLPAGFLQAGAAGVVGTLWPVNDLSTALLMARFYQLHLAGDRLAPLAALRQAQTWLRGASNEKLAEFLAPLRRLPGLTPETRAVARAAFARFAQALDANDRPYAAAYFWAPFIFAGA